MRSGWGGCRRGSRVCEAVLQPSPNKSLHLTRAAILVLRGMTLFRRPWQVSLVVERNLTVDPSVACSLLARGALFPCPPLAAGWAGRGIVSRQWGRAPRGVGREAVDPCAGRNRSRMIRTPRVRAPDLHRDQGRRADLHISPQSSASIANCCTKLALTSLSPSWWHRLSLDTIPRVGFARATWLSMGRRHPILSNGLLSRRDDSQWCRAAR